jgi:hypothetical protein
MKLLRFFFCTLFLFFSTSVLAAVSEESIRQLLPGKWRVNQTIETVTVVGTSTYTADGRVVYEGTMSGPGFSTPYKFKGKWTVSGTTFMAEITETSSPDLMPVGTIQKDTVLLLDETTYKFVDDEGTEGTEIRIVPGKS